MIMTVTELREVSRRYDGPHAPSGGEGTNS